MKSVALLLFVLSGSSVSSTGQADAISHSLLGRLAPKPSADTGFTVPTVAPDSAPSWFVDDTSWTRNGILKRVAEVKFRPGTSRRLRQTAIDQVGGVVVGGYRLPDAPEGTYFVLIAKANTEDDLLAALKKLQQQPGVQEVGFHAH